MTQEPTPVGDQRLLQNLWQYRCQPVTPYFLAMGPHCKNVFYWHVLAVGLKCLNACFHSSNLGFWHIWSFRTCMNSPPYAIPILRLLFSYSAQSTLGKIHGNSSHLTDLSLDHDVGCWCSCWARAIFLRSPLSCLKGSTYSLTCTNVCEGLSRLNKSLMMTQLKSLPQAIPCISLFVPPELTCRLA